MGNKILIVSFGSIGQRHLRNARALMPGAEIAVYRQHTKGERQVPEGADVVFDNLSDALEFAPQAVIIASPANTHLENSRAFLERGAHLFIEKPLAADMNGVEDFLQAAMKASSFVMVGYVLRFLPAMHFIRKILSEGKIGDIRTAHVQVGQYLPDWRPDSDYRKGVSAQKALGGGALLELSHELDYATWLFGKPDTLQCSRAKLSDLEIDVEDSAHVILEYGAEKPVKRVMVQLDFLKRVATMRLEVVGSQGTIIADLIKEKVTLFSPEHPEGKNLEFKASETGNEIYMRQFDFFFSKAFDGYSPIFPETAGFKDYVSPAQAADILKLVDLAKAADEKGQRVVYESVSQKAANKEKAA